MRFIAFEGLDGSGKSTLMNGLKAEFAARNIAYVETREPGGTRLGSAIRSLLLTVEGEPPVARAEALLYQADRAQNVETIVKPALARGAWVLSDRYAASSLAFQAGGRAIGQAEIEWLNRFSTSGLEPDLYVLLDLSVEEAVKRLHGRGQDTDRFEREKSDFHERVRQAYLQLARVTADRWLVLNADGRAEDLLKRLLAALKSRQWLD